MGKDIATRKQHPVPALFTLLGIEDVTPKDSFTVTYRGGLLEAHIKRESGKTETAVLRVKGGGFQQTSTFDPDRMDKDDRNELINTLYKKGKTQTEIAKMFGLSQPMISRILE